MPATITHAYFAKDLYNMLDKDIKNKIKDQEKALMMFSQNTDPLMFYNILSLKKGKKIRKLQKISHTQNVDLLFENLINFMKTNKYYEDPKTLSFLYGMICHYKLDSNAHPFIFYKTGNFQKKKKETHKYNGLHTYMENYIDNYMLRKNNQSKINIKEFCFDLTPFTKELNETIDYTFEKTFKVKNMSKIYYKSLKQMEKFITLFRLDPYKYKNKIYKLFDIFTPKSVFKLETISYHVNDKRKKDYLNTNHNTWNYPVDKSIKNNKSFDDIYECSLKEAKIIISNIHQYFYKKKKINIHELFKNKSYLTGIDCENKKEQKYFEF